MRKVFLLVASLALPAGALDALKESGIEHGLCVVLPATNGGELAQLTNHGALLVHGLAMDDGTLKALRLRLQELGLYGIATAAKPMSLSPLPYAGNLVNLLICDQDALRDKTPKEDELLRILAPAGTLFVKRGGEWKKISKQRPVEMDQWTHFDYDSTGTGVSHDRLVAPPAAIQWRMEIEPYTGLGGNPAAYRPYAGYRLAGNRAFFEIKTGSETDGKNIKAPLYLVGRDAFNGLPIWKTLKTSAGSGTPQEYQFATNEARVFTFPEPGAYAVAYDAASGKVVTTFDNGAKSITGKKFPAGYYMLRATNDVLVECALEKLYALDANTGVLKWAYEEKNGYVCFPRVLEKDNRVLAQVVEKDLDKIQGRWANIKTTAVLCLALDTGKQIWRSNALEGQNIGQLIQSGDSIYAFNPAGIGAADDWGKGTGLGIVAKLNSSDGTLLWKSANFKWGYNLLVRDNKPCFATPGELNTLDPNDGSINAFWKAPFNNRCNRTSATDDWIVMGMGNFVDRDGVATVKGISRGGCAQGVVVGNGLLYYTPNTCHCITMLRGHLALSPEKPLRDAVPDSERIDRSAFETSSNATPTDLSGVIASEWTTQIARGALETPPVKDGEREIVAVIHEHRVECRKEGKRVWSFTAGGRVSQPPLLDHGLCCFGAHDGCLYCLDAATGALRWRFTAAPYERNFVSHGQVESSWPVYNAVMFGGNVCCSAGLHPETGDGIFVWGLNPETGAIAWRKHLKRSLLLVKPGGKIAPNRVMNSPLESDGTRLSIVGISFTPDESEAAINSRIDSDSMGDKNRNWGWSLRAFAVDGGKKN